MFKISVKGLWAHKRRMIGTVLAVVFGVAFLAGTLVLSDTMRASFDEFFTEANAGTDAVVRSEVELGSEQSSQRGLVDETLAATIGEVDGVAVVAPEILAPGQLVDTGGDRIGGNGPPTFAGNWITEPEINPWTLAEGRPPEGPGEVVIDRYSAKEGDFEVGDTTLLLTPDPVDVTIVGIATFGNEDSIATATFAMFTLDDAQRHLMPDPTKVTDILVAAEPGISQRPLVDRIETALPSGIEAITGAALTDENNQDINDDFLGFLRTFLLVFAGIALLVATFSIYNTFSIIIAQRIRESALLRALGASRRQVLVAISLEAVLLGLVASGIGLAAGMGLASALQALFDAAGFGLPSGGLEVTPGSVVTSLVVGMVVTQVASIAPAIKAARVPPIAALRSVELDRSGVSRIRMVLGMLATIAGIAVVIASVAVGGGESLAPAGLGSLLTIVGLVVLGPVVARPMASTIGAPLPRLRRVTGRLARDNATRNPRRTSATASALMIGVGVVTLFTVFGASVKAAVDDAVAGQFTGDLVISDDNFSGAGLSPQLARDIEALPETEAAVGISLASLVVDGDTFESNAADPARLEQMLDLDVVAGSLGDLAPNELAVSKAEAEARGWKIGDMVTAEFADGAEEQFAVGAIYASAELLDDMVLPVAAWEPHANQLFDVVVLASLAEGVSLDQGKRAVDSVGQRYHAPDALDRDEYVDTVAAEIDQALTLVYVLLVLAIVIALMGIANTLSLSVYERTRELGLLRAVGQTRSQTRAMVRWESVIISVFGTIGGIGLGLFLGWALIRVASDAENLSAPFTVPVGRLLTVLVVGAVVGVLAGLRPARRAAKLDVLQAIATE